MDTAERRRAPRLDAAGMPRWRVLRAPAEIFDFFGVGDQKIFLACGGQLISLLSHSQLFHTT